jgi:hypothetical protein
VQRVAGDRAPDHAGLAADRAFRLEGDTVPGEQQPEQELGVAGVADPRRLEAVLPAHGEHVVVPAGGGGAGWQDEIVTGQVGQGGLGPPGQRRCPGQDHPEPAAGDRPEPQAGRVDRVVHQAGVQAGVGEHPQLLAGGQLLEVDLQPRPLLAQSPEESLEGDGRRFRRHADAQRTHGAVAGPAHDRAHPLLGGQQAAGLVAQQQAGRGEGDLPPGPVEESHAQLPFQPLHRLAQRRLRDAEHFGRAAEVQLLRHHREVVQVPEQIHSPTVRDARWLP